MNEDEAKKFIIRETTVTRQQVTLAKAFILEKFQPATPMLIDSFLESVDARMPEQIILVPRQIS